MLDDEAELEDVVLDYENTDDEIEEYAVMTVLDVMLQHIEVDDDELDKDVAICDIKPDEDDVKEQQQLDTLLTEATE